MTCRACGRDVPDGIFCTVCGVDQRPAASDHPRSGRSERYAAHPEEEVLRPSLLTTLLPHLDRDRVDEFRWAFFAGLAVIILLYLAGLITAAILVAAFLMPLLYVLYLYEVRTYRDAPATVFGLTMGAGVVLGVLVTALANAIRPSMPVVAGSPFGVSVDVSGLLLTVIAIPLVQELVKPAPAVLLRRLPAFPQTIDGLVFGVAAGLGFALGQTLIHYADVFSTMDVRTDPANWMYPLITAGILLPVLHGSSTGLITAALWRPGLRAERRRLGALLAAVASQVAFAAGSQLVVGLDMGLATVLAWQALVVAALLVVVRFALHVALVEEAISFGFERVTCPNCRDAVTAGGFCPSCGVALAASTVQVHGVAPASPRPGAAS